MRGVRNLKAWELTPEELKQQQHLRGLVVAIIGADFTKLSDVYTELLWESIDRHKEALVRRKEIDNDRKNGIRRSHIIGRCHKGRSSNSI